MNDPSDLESMLRSLHPGTLPPDLRQRLATPPAVPSAIAGFFRRPLWIAAATLSAAAVVVLCLHRPDLSAIPSAPLSVHHQESTLVDSRVIGYVENNGRVWSLEERQWQDDEFAACSSSPVRVHLSRVRNELVYQPVSFD